MTPRRVGTRLYKQLSAGNSPAVYISTTRTTQLLCLRHLSLNRGVSFLFVDEVDIFFNLPNTFPQSLDAVAFEVRWQDGGQRGFSNTQSSWIQKVEPSLCERSLDLISSRGDSLLSTRVWLDTNRFRTRVSQSIRLTTKNTPQRFPVLADYLLPLCTAAMPALRRFPFFERLRHPTLLFAGSLKISARFFNSMK